MNNLNESYIARSALLPTLKNLLMPPLLSLWFLRNLGGYFPLDTETGEQIDIRNARLFVRWFKFTLKPPYTIKHGNLSSAIWDTSHWTSFVKFGLKTA